MEDANKKIYVTENINRFSYKPNNLTNSTKIIHYSYKQKSLEKQRKKSPPLNFNQNQFKNLKKNSKQLETTTKITKKQNVKLLSSPTEIYTTLAEIRKRSIQRVKANENTNQLKQVYSQNNLINTETQTIIRQKSHQYPQFKLQNNIIKNKSSVRRTFQTNYKYRDESQSKKQITKISSTLNYLQDKINSAKKQIQKKKQKRVRQEQKNQKLFYQENSQDLESISNPQSVHTVKKLPHASLSSVISRMSKPQGIKSFDFNPYAFKKNSIYYISEILRAANQKNSIAYEHIKTSLHFLKQIQDQQMPPYPEIQPKKVNLKKSEYYKDKKTIVFDLDQTLIHCIQNDQSDCDIQLKIKLPTGECINSKFNIRPCIITLLNQLRINFQLIIFTASLSCYADVILDYIDPSRKIFKHRLYRQHCYETKNGTYIKDLRIINRSLSDMVLIDNAAYSYAFQLENGIPILPYYQGKNDFQFPALKKYLQKLINVKDVREINKNTFKFHHYTRYNNPTHLIQQLYGKQS